MTIDAQYFVDKADQCFRLARLAAVEPACKPVAAELEALGNEFLKKAVEMDTERDRAQTQGSE